MQGYNSRIAVIWARDGGFEQMVGHSSGEVKSG